MLPAPTAILRLFPRWLVSSTATSPALAKDPHQANLLLLDDTGELAVCVLLLRNSFSCTVPLRFPSSICANNKTGVPPSPHSSALLHLSAAAQIIDYGLMATIEKEEMDAMVRAIIDLANRRYDAVVRDFIALKFLEPDVDKVAVEAVLGAILDQALEGGGAKSINFQTLSDELASVTFDFPFRIPPAFALLLRALSVLEGIALIGNKDFKLIMEAVRVFPAVRHVPARSVLDVSLQATKRRRRHTHTDVPLDIHF
jgi:predicted unusual protein kinase regulating ubiquinone biosynthesis (AarF/ABC1/UbiB family)